MSTRAGTGRFRGQWGNGLLVAALLLGGAADAAAATPFSAKHKKWLEEEVPYLISDEEKKLFRQLPTDAERDRFIEDFWLARARKASAGDQVSLAQRRAPDGAVVLFEHPPVAPGFLLPAFLPARRRQRLPALQSGGGGAAPSSPGVRARKTTPAGPSGNWPNR